MKGAKVKSPDGTVVEIAGWDSDLKRWFTHIGGAKCFVDGNDWEYSPEPSPALKEVADKIEAEAEWRSTNGHGGKCEADYNMFKGGAAFGYSLAQEENSRLQTVVTHLQDMLNEKGSEAGRLSVQVEQMREALKQIEQMSDKPVYYIDGIPCTFYSVQRDCAKVGVIDVMTFQIKDQYIYKFNGLFAHGETVKKAKEDAERKYYSSLGVEESLAMFKKEFKSGVKYENTKFYQWHSILTGSCDSGKDLWMSQHGIDLSGEMTVDEFVKLTKGSYGGETIARIVNQ